MKPIAPVVVEPADWADRVAGLVAEGFAWLDFLTAIDRRERIEVIVRLVAPDTTDAVVLVTSIPGESALLDSVCAALPGADWYEREAGEMFGITFVNHPDPRPLLTRPGHGRPPLRKSTPLPARVDTDWPGAEPTTSRRRTQPPGVLDTWERG